MARYKTHRVTPLMQARYEAGIARAQRFLAHNNYRLPTYETRERGPSCGWYRDGRVTVVVSLCSPGGYSAPGQLVDRTPYGVVAHETAHYVDDLSGWRLSGEFWRAVCEKPVTKYGRNKPVELFAEFVRVFVTNPQLLRAERPEAYRWLRRAGLKALPRLDATVV